MKVWVELTRLSGRKLDIDVDYISLLSTDGKAHWFAWLPAIRLTYP